MRSALIVGLLWMWAAPAAADPSGPVAAVKFRGNDRMSDAKLRATVSSKRGADYDADTVAADIEALWSTRAFTDVKVEARETKRGVRVTFVVKERPIIRAVKFTGTQGALKTTAKNTVTLRKDTYFDEAVAKRDADELRATLRDLGYWHADASIKTSAKGGDVTVEVDVRPGPVVVIRKLDFAGNESVSDKKLRSLVAALNGAANTKGGVYIPTWFRGDLHRITSHYYDRGHVDVKIKDPVVTESEDGLSLDISVTIEEGPEYSLSKLDFTGDLLESKKHYRTLCRSKVRARFHRTRLANDIERIRTDYAEQGYKHASITPLTKIDMETHTVEVTLEITKGSP